MLEKLPQDLQEVIKEALEGEAELSYNKPDKYNSFVADVPYATSISASSRTFIGGEAVKAASVNVAKDNDGERNRELEWIAAECEGDMAYILFRSKVETHSVSRNEWVGFGWVITIVFRKIDGQWKIVHRQNTRLS